MKEFDSYIKAKYDISSLVDANPYDIIFFDIETTGFMPSDSMIYMIGLSTLQDDDIWHIRQFLAESLSEERELLDIFSRTISKYNILISYNGDNFDIPFVKKCCENYSLGDIFCGMKSIDIYANIRHLKSLLNVEHMNQKSMERFIGIYRKDLYNGRELIDIYNQYIIDQDEDKLKLLVDHNCQDIEGLISLISLLSYCNLSCKGNSNIKISLSDKCMSIVYDIDCSVPKDISISSDMISISVRSHIVSIDISLYKGIAMYYLADYKDYYYLLHEDMIIHKSIGEFVDKNSKRSATAREAYIKKNGTFLPIFGTTDKKIFYKEYRGAIRYISLDDFDINDHSSIISYIRDILKYLKVLR